MPSSGRLPAVDVEGVMLGLGGGTLRSVRVITKEGAVYQFPDMPEEEVKKVLPERGRILETMPSLMMVNASFAVVTIPFRIIKSIQVGEEVLWVSPA